MAVTPGGPALPYSDRPREQEGAQIQASRQLYRVCREDPSRLFERAGEGELVTTIPRQTLTRLHPSSPGCKATPPPRCGANARRPRLERSGMSQLISELA